MPKVRVNWGQCVDGSPVKLFVVYNTSHNDLYVLARDKDIAMSIAYTANHIYGTEVKHAPTYSRSVYEVTNPNACNLSSHWSLIQQAIAQRVEGTVHFEGDRFSIGDEAFAG